MWRIAYAGHGCSFPRQSLTLTFSALQAAAVSNTESIVDVAVGALKFSATRDRSGVAQCTMYNLAGRTGTQSGKKNDMPRSSTTSRMTLLLECVAGTKSSITQVPGG